MVQCVVNDACVVKTTNPTVIVLAAGRGQRFADSQQDSLHHKLEQPMGADTVLALTLQNVIASLLPLVVVTTAALAPQVRALVAGSDIVTLTDAEADPGFGMGRSIARGVQASGQSPGWLVLPADMPLVRPDTLVAVASALLHHPVAYAQHRGQRGHPVGFSSELYSELSMLAGDEGARRVMARYPSTAVEVEDGGVLMDIDTADDLLLAQAIHAGDQAGLAALRKAS